jgi:DNA-binding winged helix-turn-helix (wHTH) protein/predicted ATPase
MWAQSAHLAEMLFVFSGYVLDTGRRELRRGESVRSVQPQVFDLLEYLIRNRDRVVSKDDMLNAVWGGRIVSESTLATRINAARGAIGDNGESQHLIRTLARKGIRFVGEVREAEDEPQPPRAGTSLSGAASGAAPRVEAERRQLTVMSCDFAGVRELATRLDPEELRSVIGACQACCAQVAAHWDGTVAQFAEGGATIHFSYPQAHEDDAERAVLAGLDLLARITRLETGRANSLSARIGIATGLVVVGGHAAGEAPEAVAVGEAPMLAAALRSVAPLGAVMIAASTKGLLGELFEYDAVESFPLDGFPNPIAAWRVTSPREIESRFEALRASDLTALVGREEESELLLRRWSRAKSGAGQVVLLSGEAGIGKSRLAAVLQEHLASEPHMRLRYFCSPQHTDSALYPIIGQMERAAKLARDDTPQAKLDKLAALLAKTSTPIEDAALIAEMLSLPNDGRYPTRELSPEQRRHGTLEALISQTEALARQNPVLMIFEDAHWTDPTSLEALGRVVDRIVALRMLLIVTFRPEFEPPWIGRPHVTALTINRLTKSEVDAMIDRVVGNKLIPVSVRPDIVERSDGIPLFVEEMTKAVLEAEGESAAQHVVAAISSPTPAVPASLYASLMARLDRLGPAKEVAQIGAAIGREFSHALLAAVVRQPEAELRSALDRLIAAGLLFRLGAPPHAAYLFKHALVQDAAYGTLLREPRRALHARIAEILERQFAEIAENQPELVARHCTEAGLIEKAAALWGKAGQRSLERSALVEAIEQLTQAIDLIAALPATPTLRQQHIEIQVALISPLLHVKGYATPEAKAAADRARLLIEQAEALGEPLKDPLLLFSVLFSLFLINFNAFDGDAMRKLAPQFLALAEKQGVAAPITIGHSIMGVCLTFTGEVVEGQAHFDRALELYDPEAHRPLATRFSVDSKVRTLGFRSPASWFLGYPETALADSKHAIEYAREIGQAGNLMFILYWACVTETLCGNYASGETLSNELVVLADQKGSLFWNAMGVSVRGCIFASAGRAADATRVITSGLTAYRSLGTTLMVPFYSLCLATAHADLRQFDDSRRCMDEAITAVETANKWFEAEVHRIAGEIALRSPEPDAAKAQAYFERALAVARAQQTRSWELRAAMSMARLWRDRGKRDKARDLLAPIYGWFTEGFDTLDLKQAKELLDELVP